MEKPKFTQEQIDYLKDGINNPLTYILYVNQVVLDRGRLPAKNTLKLSIDSIHRIVKLLDELNKEE